MAITRPLTLDEFLLLPEKQPALEFTQGEIKQKMSPMARHGKLQGELYARFNMHGTPRPMASAFTETRVIWPREGVSYVPDVIAYRVERVPADANGDVPDRLTVPPDVAVEIASPGQGLTAQMNRCRWYVAHGVSVSLLVRPEQRAVWTFRPGAERGPLRDADVVDLGDVLPGLSFMVAELFAALRTRLS